jgi:nucleoside-diphosphate-sugar epimerase
MRICLVGGLGTLGADIVDAYHSKHQLLIVDDGLESCLTVSEVPSEVQVVYANAAQKESYLKEVMGFNPELVIYLATTVSNDQLRGFESVQGLANFCQIGSSTSTFPIMYIQSFLTRDVSEPVSAQSPISARESYGIWKMASEYLLQSYQGRKTSVVLSSVVSPRISVGAIPAFTKRILSGENISVTDTYRDYLSPKDFIAFLDAALELGTWPKECVVGSSKAISTKELAQFVAAALDVSLDTFEISVNPPKITDPKYVVFDIEETEKLFNWTPKEDLFQAIANCVNSIKSSGQTVRQHH